MMSRLLEPSNLWAHVVHYPWPLATLGNSMMVTQLKKVHTQSRFEADKKKCFSAYKSSVLVPNSLSLLVLRQVLP